MAHWNNAENFAKKYFSNGLRDLVKGGGAHVPSLLEAIRNASASLEGGDDAENLLLWDGKDAPDWVACTQYNNTCYGSISKSDWYNRETRGTMCNKVFAEQVIISSFSSSSMRTPFFFEQQFANSLNCFN